MKIIRYLDRRSQIHYGALQENGSTLRIEGDVFGTFHPTDELADLHKLLTPVIPTAIMAIGLNYRKHAQESGAAIPEYPVLFFKGPNALQNPGDPIRLPAHLPSDQVDYEGELAVVIGKACKNVSPSEALQYVIGYTCANDVSARDWQKQKGGGQWCRGKTFDTFAPLGPCLVTPDEIPNPNQLRLRTTVSGQVMQDWNTDDMIFDVPALVSFLSGSTTLFPGTMILTGTPHGVGMAQIPPRWLVAGDEVTVEIERIGILANPVEREQPMQETSESA